MTSESDQSGELRVVAPRFSIAGMAMLILCQLKLLYCFPELVAASGGVMASQCPCHSVKVLVLVPWPDTPRPCAALRSL